jgi:hypothetical protein
MERHYPTGFYPLPSLAELLLKEDVVGPAYEIEC